MPCIDPSARHEISTEEARRTTGTHLKSVIEVADLTKVIQEEIDPGFVILHERVKNDHVCLFRIRRLVGQILQHLCDLKGIINQLRECGRLAISVPKSTFVEGAWQEHPRQAYTLGE